MLAKHGFARHQQFQLLEHRESLARYLLQSNADTLKCYPWHFELQVSFQLLADHLKIHYEVRNKDESELLFNLGSHPAFHLPLENSSLSDYSIQFDQLEDLELYSVTPEGLLDPGATKYTLGNRQIELSETIFDNDALVFKNINSSHISLLHRSRGTRLSVVTGGAPHIGIWAKPGAEFVCIEPWWGHADFSNANREFAQKSSIQSLPPGMTFSTSIEIKPSITG